MSRNFVSVVPFALPGIVAFFASAAPAHAQVMDFNDLSTGQTLSTYTENGITLAANDLISTFDTATGAASTTGAYFHAISPPNSLPSGTSFTFSKGGTAFDLLSIDILQGGGAPVEYIASNGKTVFFATTGIKTFGSDFASITSFQQITTANRTSRVLIDDVTLGATTTFTPEPSTLAFLLTGGVSAGLALRRRRK